MFLRKNSSEIIEKIKESGIEVCPCANFKGSIWLDYGYGKVHGIGYFNPCTCEEGKPEENVKIFLEEDRNKSIDCGEDLDLFINTIKNGKEKNN